MSSNRIEECNKVCLEKYKNWKEDDLIKKIIELDSKESEYSLRGNILKNGLLAKLCALECGVIEKGWKG